MMTVGSTASKSAMRINSVCIWMRLSEASLIGWPWAHSIESIAKTAAGCDS